MTLENFWLGPLDFKKDLPEVVIKIILKGSLKQAIRYSIPTLQIETSFS